MKRQRRTAYSLHLMTVDGWGRTAGTFPSRDLAEALGEALKSLGSCTDYDVITED